MVHTRNQPGRDLSPATSGHPTTTNGDLVPATTYSTVISGVKAAGDSVTTGSKTATGGLLSSRPGGTLAVTSPRSGNAHFSASATATPRTRVASSDASTSLFGQTALESASANLVSTHDREPLVTGPGRFFRTGAYFGPVDRATMLPPPLRPNYLGEYGRGYSGYIPPLARYTADLFWLTASTHWPPITQEPQESLLDGIVARQRLEMSGSQIAAVAVAEGQSPRVPNGLSIEREPQEESGVSFDIGRQLRDLVDCA